VWADGEKALITLRDASGQVVADYLEANATTGLTLQREYVHANGQLVAVNSNCGPRPALANPTTDVDVVWFDKTDYHGAEPVGNYTVFIKSASSGATNTLSLPSNTPNHFSLPQSALFPNAVNWIQIETDAACGHTGYSNVVSYAYTPPGGPPGGSCLGSIGSSRSGISGTSLNLKGFGACVPGTTYNIYFFNPNEDANSLGPLNGPTPVSDPSALLENIPCGSGDGYYWIRPVSPVTHHELAPSPEVLMTGASCSGGGDEADLSQRFTPGLTGMNAQYVHWDHLGSTRMITDEHGVSIAAFKYYPFGMEAESSGGDELRQKFTGHERDDRVGLDYMMARSCRMALGRFLEPDPYEVSARPALPQSWNRYAYVLNNPVNAIDPDGYAEERRRTEAGGPTGSPLDDDSPVQIGNDVATGQMSLDVNPTLDVVLKSASVPGDTLVGAIVGGAQASESQTNVTLTTPNGMAVQGGTNGAAIGQSISRTLGPVTVTTNLMTTSDGRIVSSTSMTNSGPLAVGPAGNSDGKKGIVLAARAVGGGGVSVSPLARFGAGFRGALRHAKRSAGEAARALRDALNKAFEITPGRTTPAGVP
jgi:RHS repeat-associated protein